MKEKDCDTCLHYETEEKCYICFQNDRQWEPNKQQKEIEKLKKENEKLRIKIHNLAMVINDFVNNSSEVDK